MSLGAALSAPDPGSEAERAVPAASLRRAVELDDLWRDLVRHADDRVRLAEIVEGAVAAVTGDRATVLLPDEPGGVLRPVVGPRPHPDGDHRHPSDGATDLRAARPPEHPEPPSPGDERVGPARPPGRPGEGGQLVVVPMAHDGAVVGQIAVERPPGLGPHTDIELRVLLAVAERAAVAVAGDAGPAGPVARDDFAMVFTHGPEPLLVADPGGRVLAANRAACRLFGATEPQLLRRCLSDLVRSSAGSDGTVGSLLVAAHPTEVVLARLDGSSVLAEASGSLHGIADGTRRVVVALRDVTASVTRRRELEAVAREAVHDHLTGLLNRRGFDAAASELLRLADRQELPVELAFFDLDDLKGTNDREGHAAGDARIVGFARVLAEECRASDLCCRFGGDEFVLVAYDAEPGRARAIARRVTDRLTSLGGTRPATVGVASYEPGSGVTLDELVDRADRAMLAAKHHPAGDGARRSGEAHRW